MNGCIYRTEGNKCKQFSVGGVLSFCYLDGKCDCKIPSNADRIRAMTDEELAEWIELLLCPSNCPDEQMGEACARTSCDGCWLSWLKAPAEEVDNGT